MQLSSSKNSIYETVIKLCETREMTLRDLSDALKFNYKKFLKELENYKLSATNLKKVSWFFNLSTDDLMDNKIDWSWIKNYKLPKHYSFSAGSKLRTSLPVLYFIEKNYGLDFLNSVLNKVKVPQTLLNMPDKIVSIKLLADLLDELSERGLTENHMYQMGIEAAKIKENYIMKKEFSWLKRPYEVYEKLFEETILKYESNFDYKIIDKNARSITIKTSPKDERVEDFKSYFIDNRWVVWYRMGACAAHLKYINQRPAFASLKNSIHFGGKKDIYTLSWA